MYNASYAILLLYMARHIVDRRGEYICTVTIGIAREVRILVMI